MKYEKLFSPIKINKFTYKNRIVSAPMVFGLVALDSRARDSQYCKIAARARGGAAAVCVGETDVNFTDANRVPTPFCDFTDYISEEFRVISRFAEIIHENDAVAIAELSHPGAEKDPFEGQKKPVGPVSFIKPNGVQVDALDEAGMDRIANDFAVAAKFMINAGFDGIIVHGGHGFLFTQFLSPRTNTRTDGYGGPIENRGKFPIQIMRAIRETIGPNKILDLRISGEEGIEGGITTHETGVFCQMLGGVIDSVHVSSGLYNNPVKTHQFSSMFHPHGVNAEVSAIIKGYVDVPVGVIGGINSPELAEEILASGKADYIILGRQMIADPEYPNKAKRGEEDTIRRCVRCYTCFPGSPEEGYTDLKMSTEELMATAGYCAINPASGRPNVVAADPPKKLLVIGGGAAGMQAALTSTLRGHKVVLVERGPKLGGILNFTDTDVDKQDLRNFKNVLIHEVGESGVELRLNTESGKALIDEIKPDAVIIAIGALPSKPPISGINTVHSAIDVYYGYDPGKKVIMVGGGLVGCEAALHLAKTGHCVTIVEMLDKIAGDAFGMYREALTLEMDKEGITSVIDARCLEMAPTTVKIEINGEEKTLKGDTVLYALGMKPLDTSALREAAGDIPCYVVGDCDSPGNVNSALKGGYDAALAI